MKLGKYSIGIGDRFGVEGTAQLRALQTAETFGVYLTPVWNKSNREHSIIGTTPQDARRGADTAVKRSNWRHSYFVDADHIGLETVDRFLDYSDFFTIDVADFIGVPAAESAVESFVRSMKKFAGPISLAGTHTEIRVTDDLARAAAQQYLAAVDAAAKVYSRIREVKGEGNFVTEISVDEAKCPQNPAELFLLLALIADRKIPIQTIAPKFTGSFLKGIDYVGRIDQFAREFEDDLAVLTYSVRTFDLPVDLKLSVHSGSDKFSLYPIIRNAMKKFDAGIHLKTAGTTWLEEVIGLAASGGEGLRVAKRIYRESYQRYDELCKPYLAVIDIDKVRLPSPAEVDGWSSEQVAGALRHDQSSRLFNPHLRQLVHIGYKVAAEMGGEFTRLLQECRTAIEANVTTNIFLRHVQPLFIGSPGEKETRKNLAGDRVSR